VIVGVHAILFSTDAESDRAFFADVLGFKAKGVQLDGDVTEQAFGLVTAIRLPGGGRLGLYEPRHPSPLLRSAEAPRR
jgi:hypothetical protein